MVDARRGRKRTAVLVVHGMGSQRALETVRGVVKAVWTSDEALAGHKRVWSHPERSGADVDLTVMTTSELQTHTANGPDGDPDGRQIDFHELYWAHLMSETKPVAVLLWLYELARKGPSLRPGLNVVWWGGATFLCLLNLALALLALQAIMWFSGIGGNPLLETGRPEAMIVGPLLMVILAVLFAILVSVRNRAYRLPRLVGVPLGAVLVLVLVAAAIWGPHLHIAGLRWLAAFVLPPAVALAATYLLMRGHGLRAFLGAAALSVAFYGIYVVAAWSKVAEWLPVEEAIPWSLGSRWSTVAAFTIIGVYLALNAVFLQPYLGDVARYVRNSPANVAVRREIRRQAVATLAALHDSRDYDRIVVVAHSLGTIVAYDMLRAYYSTVCDEMPCEPKTFGPDFEQLDQGEITLEDLRTKGREIIRKMAALVASRAPASAPSHDAASGPKAWLVTDFVTLGSPLTNARYFLCDGCTREELQAHFDRRVEEREFPTCPPHRLGRDGRLTFIHPETNAPRFHHGSLFGLTRWTNIYFPEHELFWGDAIGGSVSDPVGDQDSLFGLGIINIPAYKEKLEKADFFTHTRYWDVAWGGPNAPYLASLRRAVDLTESGAAIRPQTEPPKP